MSAPRSRVLFERMSESIMTQVTGRDRPLLGGVVTADDADSASLFDMARNILGNPYAPATGSEDDGSDDHAGAWDTAAGDAAVDDQAPRDDPGTGDPGTGAPDPGAG